MSVVADHTDREAEAAADKAEVAGGTSSDERPAKSGMQLSRPVRWASVGLGSFSGLSFLWQAVAVLQTEGVFPAVPLSLALVGALTCAMVVLVGMGRFAEGPAMTLCIAGLCVVGAAGLLRLPVVGNVGQLARDPFLLSQGGVGAAFVILSGWALLARSPGETRRVLLGVGLLAAVFGILGLVLVGPGGVVLREAAGLLEIVRISALLVGGVVLAVVLSVGGHLVITGFERAADAKPGPRDAT
ncbi:MAG: hypothetical protein AAGB51_14505 [Planctomycetota bacterium]